MNDADRKILPLLAGWLDGELTPDEAKRVEAALEHSAELRAVLEEWRSVDGIMPSADPVRPEADWEALALRVEDAVAADGERESAAQSATVSMRPEATTRPRQGWFDRGWAWFGTRRWAMGGSGAIAVAVLTLLLWPQQVDFLGTSKVEQELRIEAPEPVDAGVSQAPQKDERDRDDQFVGEAESNATPAPPKSAAPQKSKKDTPGIATAPPAGIAADPPAASTEGLAQSDAKTRDDKAPGTRSIALESFKEPSRDQSPDPAAVQGAADLAEDDESVADAEIDARRERTEALKESSQDDGESIEVVPDQDDVTPSEFRVSSPAPTSPMENLADELDVVESDEVWLQKHKTDLDAAVAARDREALQRIIDDLERQQTTTPTSEGGTSARRSLARAAAPERSADVNALGLAVRARCEFLRLFPDAPENNNACSDIRSRYNAWRELADPTLEESWDGLRIRDLVRQVCPN